MQTNDIQILIWIWTRVYMPKKKRKEIQARTTHQTREQSDIVYHLPLHDVHNTWWPWQDKGLFSTREAKSLLLQRPTTQASIKVCSPGLIHSTTFKAEHQCRDVGHLSFQCITKTNKIFYFKKAFLPVSATSVSISAVCEEWFFPGTVYFY